MPTYVYQGLETGTTFEVEQRITERPLTHHPQTGEPVKRVIQPVGIAFKGSGFYKTDSRSGGSGGSSSAGKSESKPESQGDSGGSGESKPKDSAPAAKSE